LLRKQQKNFSRLLYFAAPCRQSNVVVAYFFGPSCRVPGLSCGVVCVIVFLAVLVEHRLLADGRTDGQSHDNSMYRASIASRGKNVENSYRGAVKIIHL